MIIDLQQKLSADRLPRSARANVRRSNAPERRAVRGFESRPVSRPLIEDFLDIAARAAWPAH
jgi:hypothetical protein